MAAIKGRNTSPELMVRQYLHSKGFRFRLHARDLPGKPDIVLPKYKTVVQVYGCFWHLHGCSNSVMPKSRTEWWRVKLEGNVKRDRVTEEELKELGWKVLVIWECEIPHKLETLEAAISHTSSCEYKRIKAN